ncbi:MAG: lipopolysaccharide transport periplasmic protein LptA [Proteobacteria bacterium]|nr:lipopolysaccharide transport periplasmic protein LptA [Pseudomonadota bacterium]
MSLAPAHAETTDRQKPINYSADLDMTGNGIDGDATLRKNVLITQGTTVVHADTLMLKRNDDNSFNATALGEPASFRTRVDNSDDSREAFAKKIVYNGKDGIVELYGDALLQQGQTEVRGQYVRYDLNTGLYRVGATPGTPDSAPTPGRVRGVFMPKADADKAGADAKVPAKDAAKAPATKSGTAAPAAAKGATTAPIQDPVPLKSATELTTAPR